MRFLATVEGGRLQIADPIAYREALAKMRPGQVVVTVETVSQRRTSQANASWWKFVVPAFQEIWSRGRVALNLPPYTKEETHSVIVQVTIGSEPGPLPGSVLHKPTRVLSTHKFWEMDELARAMYFDLYRGRIPKPNEPPIGDEYL
jgi:hypothetical protein